MTGLAATPSPQRRAGPPLFLRVLERNVVLGRHYRVVHLGRLIEPFLYLFSIGIGVGTLVDQVTGPAGTPIDYQAFVAPAMLAASAMNAAVFATSSDFFAKSKWVGSFDAMLATPIGIGALIRGELSWAVLYVGVQSAAFVVTMLAMGLVASWWAVLLVPTAMLIAYGFGGAGFVVASYLRTWLDFEYVALLIFPMFLFSASFFPLERYPEPLRLVVQAVPLYHGVDLARDLTFGTVGPQSLVSVLYLFALGRIGLWVAERRLRPKLLP